MVNDFPDTHHKKHKLPFQTSKSLTYVTDNPLEDFSDNQTKSDNNPTGSTSPPPFYTKRPNKLRMTRFKLFPKRQQLSKPNIKYTTSTLASSPEHHPTLPRNSTANTTQNGNLATTNDNLVDNNSVKDDTDSPIKVYSKTNYPFPPPSF